MMIALAAAGIKFAEELNALLVDHSHFTVGPPVVISRYAVRMTIIEHGTGLAYSMVVRRAS
jgi:hypothetical protein